MKQQYLPDKLKNKKYYNPGNNKMEGAVKTYMDNMLDNKTTYVSVVETDKEPISSNTFSVLNDTCIINNEEKCEVNFNEEKRLIDEYKISNK